MPQITGYQRKYNVLLDEDGFTYNDSNPIPVDVKDISSGEQTNDVKVTMDGEEVVLKSPTGIEGSPITVGTIAIELTFTGTTKAISIQSDQDNTGKIWFGGENVTNVGGNAFGRLDPGRAVTIEFDDSVTTLYVVSDTAAQTVFKMALS